MAVKLLKNDALVNIDIGVGFVQRIQQVFLFLVQDIKPEQFEEYKKLVETNQQLTEPWMEHLTTLSVLLRDIEKKADEQGLCYEADEQTILQGS